MSSNFSTNFFDFYFPELLNFYAIFWNFMFFLTCILFTFVSFVIIKKTPKEMTEFKWYLIHYFLWSFLFQMHLVTWRPVALWPYFIGYSTGIWKNVAGEENLKNLNL